VIHQYRKRKERETPSVSFAKIQSVSPMDSDGSGGGVRGWKRMARGVVNPQPKKQPVQMSEIPNSIGVVVGGPPKSISDPKLLPGEKPEASSFLLEEVSFCSTIPTEFSLFASAKGHELISSGDVGDFAVATR
jgi:hypothetical protein